MSLKSIVHDKLVNEIFKSFAEDTVNPGKEKGDIKKQKAKLQWKILILDHMTKRLLSTCCNMTEIASLGVTLVEDLHKKREPLSFEAIYFITPTEESIRILIADFKDPSRPRYKAAHVFFTEACSDDLINEMKKSEARKFIKTLKEINVAFLALEQKVFTFNCPEMFHVFFTRHVNLDYYLEKCAEQLATLCVTLGEYPAIRYSVGNQLNEKLASIVKQRLDYYKTEEPKLGLGPQKNRSQLIILDRGFDPISPLLHELTLQAMAYDLLPIENDVYKYTGSSGGGLKEVLLDESDEFWIEFRHQHIATVSQKLAVKIKEFAGSKRLPENFSVGGLSQTIKKMPQYQRDLRRFNTHFNLAEDCMKLYHSSIHKVWSYEQELATGADVEAEKLNAQKVITNISNVMLDETISSSDKIRLINLYIIHNCGITGENLSRFFVHSRLTPEEQCSVYNMKHLGVTVLQETQQTNNNKDCSKENFAVSHRKERPIEQSSLQIARWTPYVKDIIEEITEEKLDVKKYPFFPSGAANSSESSGVSARSGIRRNASGSSFKGGPRLIVFVVGGITFSEMRCVYEVAAKNWEIIIGSTHILTPREYIDQLKKLGPNEGH